jgi:hypothetical protein
MPHSQSLLGPLHSQRIHMNPIYTSDNIRIAYQLNWSLTVFWKSPPETDDWLQCLKDATETDGVRVLSHRFATPHCSQFLTSTKPFVRPMDVARVVKGRLQYIVRDRWPKPFQRNYDLRSVGASKLNQLEASVASQMEHHHPNDPRLRAIFADLQIIQPDVDLSRWRLTSHARYWSNLHVVLVNDWRRCTMELAFWLAVREMIREVSAANGHLLSRAGIVPDHIHLLLGTGVGEAPIDVALSYMNSIASARDASPLFMRGCYIGTCGEYDLGAIPDGRVQ